MKTEYTILYESPEVRSFEFRKIALCNASYELKTLEAEQDDFLD